MAFTVQGIFRGEAVKVTWDDGALSGDPDAVLAVEREAQIRRFIGPIPGPQTETPEAHLKSALSSYLLIRGILSMFLDVSGDPPEWPAVPPGAVA